MARAPEYEREDAASIQDLQIWSPAAGKMIPMRQVLTDIKTESEDAVIWRRNRTTTIKIHADPAARVRPNESITLQVRAYGQSGGRTGRVRQDGAELNILETGGGWISKPFRFQGADNEEFVEVFQSRAGRIFGQITGEYVMQDAAVYTAPDRSGSFRLQAELVQNRGAQFEGQGACVLYGLVDQIERLAQGVGIDVAVERGTMHLELNFDQGQILRDTALLKGTVVGDLPGTALAADCNRRARIA